MASRKPETETLGSSVSEARAKSAVAGMDIALQEKGASLNHLMKPLLSR